MPGGTSITAVLGPTNTGKTHRAVERMLAYGSGMIGLPLRLLAREVYDRITTRIGEARVALVTGEEKRVPRRPDYWVCTVEAMPMQHEVDFLAVDEVQLAAHDQRGHVFTERLLSARGRRETWFLGAETMRPMLGELVPSARVTQHPRLSRLTSVGSSKLARLPPRSAVVAFSTPQVYEIAERLRALRGGAAVVLGALSPRTRNAQVALFQSGEVEYLVATDAIGMGLNLAVDHVAFAALRKFDGREVRDLDAAELAQIAGRAGRYRSDGTFGTVAPLALAQPVTAAIEAHCFAPVTRVRWRNADVDTSSVDALSASLRRRPRSSRLHLVQGADDTEALARLAADEDVRRLARDPESVALLWDVCRVPDYRKLLVESHVALLRELYVRLVTRGTLDSDWVAAHVAEARGAGGVDRGDLDTLLSRIASIRTWTYVSNQARWVADAEHWRQRTRAIEDELSDALHERLVQRFVEKSGPRRAAAPPRKRPPAGEGAARVDGCDASHPFAALAALRARTPSAKSAAGPAEVDDWVEAVVSAEPERFTTDAAGCIAFEGRPVGQLVRGTSLLLPDVRLAAERELGAGARSRLLRRLVAHARDHASELLAPLRPSEPACFSAAARGVLYQLEQGLGTALAADASRQLAELDESDWEGLRGLGIELGRHVVYAPGLLEPDALSRRLALCRAYCGRALLEPAAAPFPKSFHPSLGVDPRTYLAAGYPVIGGRAVRADIVERIARSLLAGSAGGTLDVRRLSSWLSCSARDALRVARALGD